MKKYLFILLIVMLQCCSMTAYALTVYPESSGSLINRLHPYEQHCLLLDLIKKELTKEIENNKYIRAFPNIFSLKFGRNTCRFEYRIYVFVKGPIEQHKTLKLANIISNAICNTVIKSKIKAVVRVEIAPILVTKEKYSNYNRYYRKYTAYNGIDTYFNVKVDGKKVKKYITIYPAKTIQEYADATYKYSSSNPFGEKD